MTDPSPTDWVVTVPKDFPQATWDIEIAQVNAGTHDKNFKVGPHSKVKPGDRVFITYQGKVRGWFPVKGIRHQFAFQCDASGDDFAPGTYAQLGGPYTEIDGPEMKGFQGIRRCKFEVTA